MIQSIDITGIHYDVDETTKRYVKRKIGKLDRFLPRHARKSVTADVKLRQIDKSHGDTYRAEVIITVPDKTVLAKDATSSMTAALDSVEGKLATQLAKYKQTSIDHVRNRGVMARFKRSYARDL